ncbi:MAG: transcription-repair coupling factor [Spirochaetes bacterium]|nr:transcription-repair coupling factor [Spirochaetota bacterium]
METLHFSELLRKIGRSKPVSAIASAVTDGKLPLEIEGGEGAFNALLLARIYFAKPGQYVLIVPSENEGAEIAGDLAESGIPCTSLPWWGAAAYRELAPLSPVFAQRAKALSVMAAGSPGFVIIPQRAFLTPLPPPGNIKSLSVAVKQGERIDTRQISQSLAGFGYTRVPRVQMRGEYALRGEVLDVFMGGDDAAHRILLDFDKVEAIKRFDPDGQGSEGGGAKIGYLVLRPMKEVVWTDERIDALGANLGLCDELKEGASAIIEELIANRGFFGEELFYPLAFEKSATPLDYMAGGTLVLLDRERLENAQESLEREYQGMYARALREAAAGEKAGSLGAFPSGKKRVYPLPERILLNFQEMIDGYSNKRGGRLVSFKSLKTADDAAGNAAGSKVLRISVPCDPGRSFFGNIDYLKEEFVALFAAGWQITVAAESSAQALRLQTMLSGMPAALSIMDCHLSAGFSLPDVKFALVQESEIFGRRKRPPRSLKTVKSSPIDTFVELNPGDYVVHVNHGIGRFLGIERIKSLGSERDYISLEYAGEENVFVPVEQVNLVQRYIGNEGHPPRLDTLGSKSWENRKNKVKKSVEDMAEKLIEIYSKRQSSVGYSFSKDSQWQAMFEAAFPFDETEDQLRCVAEIKQDMEGSQPMDRLVCGDVGFGKTEVALRACFKAVMDGKQAVFLAPTTILAEQHYENFKERFALFPVKIAMLSRFVSARQSREILDQLKKGDVDLIVGTHRVIQKDVHFKNLGLIVIDEEQRFGVKDKERLKELKANVDCLTLSATPIPRTLHMSLLKIRDMSLLATAPGNRRPIETSIEEYSEERLARAIRAEIERGGQVFFLHNRVETLRDTRIEIERLVPEVMVDVAHGKMDGRALEDVMRRFVHGGFHVLVSTTIIENGIDIPNVNTIIIDRADMYGVSQLYQLRGRVGRSDRVAFAYLLHPREKSLSEIAMKRLQVISDYTELGSGFKIAMKDMEIRGAGNLLGREQSGDIYSVGFELYLRLLDEAVRRLEDSGYEAETEPLLELEYSGFIPDSYIDSQQEKMEVYKMIAAIKDREEFEAAYAGIIDRFGNLPDEAASLLAIAEIRIICRALAVFSLRERDGQVRIEFSKVSKVNVERLVRLMKESSGKIKLDAKAPNVLFFTVGNIGLQEKSEFIREKLAALV